MYSIIFILFTLKFVILKLEVEHMYLKYLPMKKVATLFIIFFALISSISAQMWNGIDTLYGNEWVQYNQSYYKIPVANDGIYRVDYNNLVTQGAPSNIEGNQLQLFFMGQEVPIHVSSDGNIGNGGYIEFYGKRNRGDLDRYLFEFPDEEMANPEYSLYSDTSAYFLTWNSNVSSQRINDINNDLASAPSTPESYCFYTDSIVFSDKWSKNIHSDFVYHSRMEKTEGFVSSFKRNQKITLEPNSIFASGPESKLSLRYVTNGLWSAPHDQNILVDGALMNNDIINGMKTFQHDYNLTTSNLGSEVKIELQGNSDNKDKSGIAFAQLTYPRIFDFGGSSNFHFKMPASNSLQYLKVSNFNAEGADPILYDLTNNQRIEVSYDGTFVNIALPPSSIERELVLASVVSGVRNVTNILQTDFVDYTQLDAEFIIISNKKLYDDGQGNNWVQEYANYRATQNPAGRNYVTTVVDIEDLYNQFSYGINRHSISIRNFGHFIKENWTDPKYVFILGKAREYQTIRSENDYITALADNSFHVPTFGALGGSDNLLLAGNTDFSPIISIGRLPAKTGVEIKNYFDKVIEHELTEVGDQTIESKIWKKRAIHLGGGNPNEQLTLRGYLEGMETILESNFFGSDITAFYKQTADPIQISQTDELKNLINDGISVLTFFGHSSTGSFDYSIDNASSYENKGRYPIMFSYGCFSGRIHTEAIGISEDFVLTPEKGAIAFFASTGIGFSNALNVYGREFYNQLGGSGYGLGVGDISRLAIKNTQFFITYLGPQMTLNGDPAIRLLTQPGPDYIVDRSSVVFDPNPISIQQPTFNLKFDVANIGQGVQDSIVIEVRQKLPQGTERVLVVSDKIPAPTFSTTLEYTIPSFGFNALGANEFYIEIDTENNIAEFPAPQAEENNTLQTNGASESITVHFISKEVLPIFPKEFGIVNNPNLTLKASTSTTFLESAKYVVQIDTVETFDSPFLLETEIEQKGGVVKWKPNIAYSNNTVYYWRVSPESDPALGGFVWRNSSFLYLAGSADGWSQSHRDQFAKDRFSNIEMTNTGLFKFIDDFKDIAVDNLVVDVPFTSNTAPVWLFIANNPELKYFGTPAAAVYVAVFDPVNINYRPTPSGEEAFRFTTNNTDERQQLINFLNDEVVDGDYVLFYTVQNSTGSYLPEDWSADANTLGTSIFDILEDEGATQVRDLENSGSLPYVFMYQKGIGALKEEKTNTIDDVLNFNYAIPGSWDNGFIESTVIGPARNWETLEWKTSSLDNLPLDEFSVDVFGIDNNGNDSLLMPNVVANNTSLAAINAEEFPYLRLQFNSQDTVNKTTIQLDHWRVLYECLPEIALNPNAYFAFQSDTLNQGEPLQLKVAVENIGQFDMDSILMKYAIIDESNNQDTIFKRISPLIVGDTLIANLNVDTRNFGRKNTLLVEANPNNDQAEQHHFNNIGFFDFFIRTDERNPILDVTFDGFHIMDGDLVSSKPNILITLKDENQYLLLDDTTSFQVLLKTPGDGNLIPIPVDGEQLTFYPATSGGTNKARLEFSPALLQDGTYQLVVLAQDVSGNQSGDLSYKVSFEVTNESSISKILNYPNPFSTSTQFVFTITGDEIPENMKIQIMTVSGKIVREILTEELGPIHVGNNVTPFRWDGTDEYGAKLANGVYLYRVVATNSNGEPFEAYNTSADKFFKNGLGKMVIIR